MATNPADPAAIAAEIAAAIATALQGTTSANPTFTPPTPKIGGIAKINNIELCAWTGGKPKRDWTALDPGAPTDPVSPNQYRSTNVSASQKGHSFRQKGLDTLFKRNGDLNNFQHHIWTRAVDCGLDSVTYVADPIDPDRMSCIIHEHTRFSLERVEAAMATQVKEYDSYDRMNDAEMTHLLMNSLEQDLAKELRDIRHDSDSFPVVWMHLIKFIRSVSIDRYEHLKARIKSRKPSQYPGQDMSQLASAFRLDAKELEIAGQYDHNLTLHMLDAFLEGGGSGNEDFRYPLRGLKEHLVKELLKAGHMNALDANKHLMKEGLTYRDVCRQVVDVYRNQFDNQKWPPARHATDSKAPPSSFGNLACSSDPVTAAQVHSLIQQYTSSSNTSSTKKSGTCHNCGKEGHWARDCKEPKVGNGKRQVNSGGKGSPNSSRKPSHQANGWKKKAPATGDPTTKVTQGRTWHWCAKCSRWSTTHGTDGHTGKAGSSTPSANAMFLNPSVWYSAVPVPLDAQDGLPWYHALLSVSWTYVFVGLILGLLAALVPSSVWTAMAHPFFTNWLLVFAPLHWLLLLLGIQLLPCHKSSFPYRPFPERAPFVGPGLGPLLRPPRTKVPRHRRQSIYGLAKRTLHRVPLDQRHVTEFHSLLGRIDHFLAQITFSKVRRPPPWAKEEGNTKRRSHCRRRSSVYCPIGHKGLSVSQACTLASPATHAFLSTTTDLPAPLLSFAQTMRAAFTTPLLTNSVLPKSQHYPVIWDSGASLSITSHRSDFVGSLKQPDPRLRLQGLARGLQIAGVGHVAWSFVDTTGMLRTLKVPAYFVPKASVRLLSTSSLLQAYSDETISQDGTRLVLSGAQPSLGQPLRNPIEILLDPTCNLPIGHAYSDGAVSTVQHALNSTITSVSASNINLSPAEKELLRWHFRLGHLGHRRIQFLMRAGTLAHSETARRMHQQASKLENCPLCTACQYAKQRQRPTPGKRQSVVHDKVHALKKENLFPGQRVSVDHFVCSTRGRLSHTYGKEDSKQQFAGGAIFVDHATGYLHVGFQVHLNTHETISSKENFEKSCRDVGVVVQEYLSDNGSSFSSQAFRKHLENFAQVIRYAGVGAHHHNGAAERSIQTVMAIARTMMLHAAIHWPDVADAALWPLAVRYAVFLFNRMPSLATGLSPHDLFTKIRWPQSNFQHCHVWGCPVYVLDHTIADGKKLPRWKPRSSRHVFMGISEGHAISAPLVLNLETGAITPQFHVVFDDWFATVPADINSLPAMGTTEWDNLFGNSTFYCPPDDDDATNIADTLAADAALDQQRRQRVADAIETHSPTLPIPNATPPLATVSNPPPALPVVDDTSALPPLPSPPVATQPLQPQFVGEPVLEPLVPAPPTPPPVDTEAPLEREILSPPSPPPPTTRPLPDVEPFVAPPPSVQRENTDQQSPVRPSPQPSPSRRSTRTRRPPTRLGFDGSQGHGYSAPVTTLDDALLEHFACFAFQLVHIDNEAGDEPATDNVSNTAFSFKARATKDPDTLSFDEAMRSPDRKLWQDAAKKEIDQLTSKGTWVEVPKSDAKTKILPGTWVFRRKRNPSGEVKKHKGRYCVRGDLAETEQETFAPVVAWSSVRLFLILTLILRWYTCSIDFSNAFVQADIDEPVWIHLPRGFQSSLGPDTCLRLKKSLYGISVAPRLWYLCILKAFKELGFKQSVHDPCLLFKQGMIVVLYVDDAGIGAKSKAAVDELVQQLKDKGFELTKEGSFSEFLGIDFVARSDGSILLTQTGLIDKVLAASGLEDCKPNLLPASAQALGSDPDGAPMDESWNYLSILGMLLYLSTNTRPDIAFAVSQAARFSAAPKQSHATAVKSIVRYLKRTRTQGTIIRPTGKLDLDLYVDADFAGLFRQEPDRVPESVKSRTGYVIMLSNCPLLFKSVLQNSISASTLEAEYNALSYALKTLLPLKRTLLEVVNALDLPSTVRTSVRARVFEDNQGAYYLATNQRITNRTKYFLVKWHWFWSHSHEFLILKVESRDQRADYFTKALPRELFEHNRMLVQGW